LQPDARLGIGVHPALIERQTMITVYKTRQNPATDSKGTTITVKCITTGCTRTVPFDYSAHNANRAAIETIHGFHPDRMTFAGRDGKYDIYAVNN
jgi:hypothetical protein